MNIEGTDEHDERNEETKRTNMMNGKETQEKE
jgi:hypothetical protein